MTEPTELERAAVDDSGPLVRFAAENVKDLDPALVRAVSEARMSIEQKTWSPEMAQQFWRAFNTLCQLILPVTLDCVTAKRKTTSRRRFFLFKRENLSLAEASSRRYIDVLFWLVLPCIVSMQLYAWVYEFESKRVDELLAQIQTGSVAAFALYSTLTKDVRDIDIKAWNKDQLQRSFDVINQSKVIGTQLRHLNYHSSLLERMTFRGPWFVKAVNTEKLTTLQWNEAFERVDQAADGAPLRAMSAKNATGLVVGVILSFFLPVLFAVVGAMTHVVRTMSDQIKTSTFSMTSPTRHLMRVTLGGLAGVVVGLFNPTTQVTLSPLAIAFLSGYGVEAVFSIFDGLIARFRTTELGAGPIDRS